RFLKRLLNIRPVNGAEKVFLNLCEGLDLLGIPYTKNPPFKEIKPGEPVVILGDELYNSKFFLKGYDKPNPIIAGIALMTHPAEWPDLLKEYPVVKYLQHCSWTNDLFIPYYGKDVCKEWPAGIDTEKWTQGSESEKKFDVLIYDKICWDTDHVYAAMKTAIIEKLTALGLTYREVVYGRYNEKDYFKLIRQCRAMIYISAHETQGFALCQAMSANVPVFAWDQGFCLDPARFSWNAPVIKTTSVPFFDKNCGMTFSDQDDFLNKMDTFWQQVQKGKFNPREYVMKNLSLKISAQKMLDIIVTVYK
ncbi:MAG: hypothetical protein JWR50_1917, partial [Mucilaginibacter sp.]|nr:hypothetical protein [Mucilaginibacter sp.]